jgi:hypothetical protein
MDDRKMTAWHFSVIHVSVSNHPDIATWAA